MDTDNRTPRQPVNVDLAFRQILAGHTPTLPPLEALPPDEAAAIRRSQAINDAIDRDKIERAIGRQDGVGDLSLTGATLRPGS